METTQAAAGTIFFYWKTNAKPQMCFLSIHILFIICKYHNQKCLGKTLTATVYSAA